MVLLVDPEVTERVPLTETAQGVVLVEGTRVPLDALVDEYNAGRSAEELVHRFSTLQLADVYAVLTYYLRHRESVDAYIARRRQAADALRTRIEEQFAPGGIRERLVARRQSREA